MVGMSEDDNETSKSDFAEQFANEESLVQVMSNVDDGKAEAAEAARLEAQSENGTGAGDNETSRSVDEQQSGDAESFSR